MRSSKSRSRSKSNRNRSVGNIVNRVFDSSGPEGKVRGTPQQIIEKYLQLARDAQLGNDRVATENFLQHAEHYSRMLGEATREAEARREMHEQHNGRDRYRDRDDVNGQSYGDTDGDGDNDGDEAEADGPIFVTEAGTGPQPEVAEPPRRGSDQAPAQAAAPAKPAAAEPPRPPRSETPRPPRREAPAAAEAAKPAPGSPLDVVDMAESDAGAAPAESGLVETPEEAPAKPRRRRARKPKADAETGAVPAGETAKGGDAGAGPALEPQEAAE